MQTWAGTPLIRVHTDNQEPCPPWSLLMTIPGIGERLDVEEVVEVALKGFDENYELVQIGVVSELRSHGTNGAQGVSRGHFADVKNLLNGRVFRITVTEE